MTKIFTELITGKMLDILVGPFRRLRNKSVLNSLLDEGRKTFDLILKNDSEQISRFFDILNCLDSQKGSEVENFAIEIFGKSVALTKLHLHNISMKFRPSPNYPVPAGADLMERLVERVYGINTPAALGAILERREDLPTSVFPYVLRSALRTWPSDKVFLEFSPLLEGKQGAGKEKRGHLEQFIHGIYAKNKIFSHHSDDNDTTLMPEKTTWDPRWLDVAVKADSRPIVCWLARPDHKRSMDYLLKLGTPKDVHYASITVHALARCQHPNTTDFFLEQLAKKARSAQYLDYELQTLLTTAKHLPQKDLPKLDAFAAKLDEKFVDAFLVAIDPLRRPTQTE